MAGPVPRSAPLGKRYIAGTMIEPAVVLEPIPAERAFVLANLFELYVHDFSEQLPIELKPSGKFEPAIDEGWWSRGDHFPFFIRRGDSLVGFALVRQGSRVSSATDVMDVAEFFVVRSVRGHGVGRKAAHALFTAFPGRWEIRVRETNVAAIRFWQGVAHGWLGRLVPFTPFTAGGVAWHLLELPVISAT
jgi:predicted acetyltransferase